MAELNPEIAVRALGTRAEWRRLPPAVRIAATETGIDRLRRLRETISTEAGLPMPPVAVLPCGWIGPHGEVIYGRTIPIEVSAGTFQFGVELPASTLAIVDDDIVLRKILAHEFGHCFWFIQEMVLKNEQGKFESHEQSTDVESAYKNLFQTDSDTLVDPHGWFGESDANTFLYYDSPKSGSETLDHYSRKFFEEWRGRGLITRLVDPRFDVTGTLQVPYEIGEHIKKLHL